MRHRGLHSFSYAQSTIGTELIPRKMPSRSCGAGLRETCARWHVSARTGFVAS